MKKYLLVFCLIACAHFVRAQDVPKDTTLKEYVGRYSFPQGSVILETIVKLGDDGVLTSSSTAGVSELVKKERDVFEITKFNGVAKFTRNSSGKITGVNIDAMGYKLEGTRVSEDGSAQLAHTKNIATGIFPAAFSTR